MPFAPFGLLTPVGTGRHNRRRDVFNTRQTLGRLGYVEPRAGAREDSFDFGLDDGLRRFQRDNGLKVDGWLAPGGETERALKRATAPRPPRTPWPDPFAPATAAAGSEQREKAASAPAKPKRREDRLGLTMPRRPGPVRALPGINPSAGRPDTAARGTPPIQPERPAPDHPGTIFNPHAGRPDATARGTPPIRRPVTAASRAENGRLVDALTHTTNPGHMPDYIVEALSRGGERAIADVTDLFEQYAARDKRGARRLAWEVRRRAKDVDGVRRRLGQPPERQADTAQRPASRDIEPALSAALFEVEEPVATTAPAAQVAQATTSDTSPESTPDSAYPTPERKPPVPLPPTPENLRDLDLDFVYDREGRRTDMYVPTNKKEQVIGKSGPTIGAGVDLGQMDAYELDLLVRRYGLDRDLADRLKPYLGKRELTAKKFVSEHPLIVSEYEARQLTYAKYSKMYDVLRNNFDQEMQKKKKPVRFDDLPEKLRTVTFSVTLQYGENLEQSADEFWTALTSLEMPAIMQELRNFGDEHDPRRKKEAEYLGGTTP